MKSSSAVINASDGNFRKDLVFCWGDKILQYQKNAFISFTMLVILLNVVSFSYIVGPRCGCSTFFIFR